MNNEGCVITVSELGVNNCVSPLPLLSHQLDNKTKKELDDHRRVRCML